MAEQKIICIKAILESEQRRINAMLRQIDKATDQDDLVLLEQGFELSAHYMNVGREMCKEEL